MPKDEAALLARALGGDRQAFDALVAPAMGQITAILRRLVGHPEDCEDILQDALTEAWNKRESFRAEAAFATWLTAIATRKATDHLRGQKRWRAEAQVAYANLCAENEVLSGEVLAAYADPEFAFDVRQHVAYCCACVGRSLPPDEMAALVLRDVTGLSAREAATVLGVSDSVLRHRLSAARSAMAERFDGLCALVSKTGMCHQCAGLRMIAAEDRKGPDLPDIDDLAARIALMRDGTDGQTTMATLHDVFWRRTSEIEARGDGDTRPLSGCGEDP